MGSLGLSWTGWASRRARWAPGADPEPRVARVRDSSPFRPRVSVSLQSPPPERADGESGLPESTALLPFVVIRTERAVAGKDKHMSSATPQDGDSPPASVSLFLEKSQEFLVFVPFEI